MKPNQNHPLTSRRQVLKATAATGLVLSAGALTGGSATAATPKRGGTFRVGLGHGSTTDSLDPATYENDFTIFMTHSRNLYLTQIDKTGELRPEIADSWEPSADAKQWSFKIRKGIEYHNGRTLTADDVVASFNHHRGDDTKSAAKPIVSPIEDIRTDGSDRVVFTLANGNADFPFLASDYHIPILPADEGKVDWQSGVGAGGYALQGWEPGVRATYKRHPNFYRDDQAFFDGIDLLTIADTTARTTALISDEIDVMDRVDLKTVGNLERKSGIRVEETSGTAHYTIPMNTQAAPFSDNNVRLALKWALDREALVNTILKGHGVVGNDHPIGSANRYHAADLEQHHYDPDKAKHFMKKAGLSTLKVDLHAADAAFAGAIDAAVLYKEHAANAGIEINVVREPNDGYWGNVWLKKDWVFSYWGGRPTEDWMFTMAYAADAAWNEAHWQHEKFNKLLLQGRSEIDEGKRREIYHEMQRICRDEGGSVVPMFNNYVWAVNDRVKNSGQIAANKVLDGQLAALRWWFA